MATNRPQRPNAGRNISKLINQELGGDDFYSTVYGGFEEAEEDIEYETEGSESDSVDSDFDLDESQWEESAGDSLVEEQKAKKRQWIKPQKTKSDVVKAPKPKKPRTTVTTTTVYTSGGRERVQRSLRQSTHHTSQEYQKRFEIEKEEQKQRKLYYKKPKPERKLTQRELLEQARKTERENLASLEAYSKLEAEKRSVDKRKVVQSGPVVRFHSVSMATITDRTVDHSLKTQPASDQYTRNFLVFTDTQGFPGSYFPCERPHPPQRRFCPVTGLPARYIDPLTGTPYATVAAFKMIRNRYVAEGEQTCEKRLLQLSSWLLEKKRKKMEHSTD